MLLLRMPVKKSLLKKENGNYPDGNRRIREIEYRTEEFKILAAHKRYPGRIVRPDKRKI